MMEKPRFVLRAGVVGKIRLRDADTETRLRKTAAQLIDRLVSLLETESADAETREFFSKEKPVFRLISSLAAGSDQIISSQALDGAHEAAEVDLHAILPFDRSTYRDQSIRSSLPDAGGELAAEKLDQLLERADHIVSLDGVYAEGEAGRVKRHRAYRAAAWFLLQQSDLLIAAFDSRERELPGGTVETVGQALLADIPVLAIDLADTDKDADELPIRILRKPRDFDHAKAGNWQEDTAVLVKQLVALPDPSGSNKSEEGKAMQEEAMRSMREFYAESKARNSYRNRLWKLFMRVIGGGSSKPAPAKPIEPFESHRKRAGALSGFYTNRYRGAFLINFILLVVVVVVATGFESLGSSGRTPIWLALVKLGIILFIYWNAFFANSRQWHRKGIDFRVLSELLRSSNYLAPIGVATPNSRLPVHYSLNELSHSWSQWLFRSIVRAAPIVLRPEGFQREVSLTESELATAREGVADYWLQGQIDHHRANAGSMGRVFSRLEKVGLGFIRLMLIAVIAQAALEIYRDATDSETGGALWGWLVFIGAVAPAIVASCAGVVYQSESRRLADRSAAMAGQLEEWKSNLLDFEPHPHGCDSWTLARDVLAIAQVMADEVT
ncbi:MAG: hypothetical protein AAGA58_18875, partial [Verrucomicrobiota bacterium]